MTCPGSSSEPGVSSTAQGIGESQARPAGLPATALPLPLTPAGAEWGVGVRLTHPTGPGGRGHFSPSPPPLAAAPGAGRGCQMLGRRRRREPPRAKSCGASQRARVPLAGPLGPRCACPAGVRRGTSERGGGSATGMHSARLDSFLGQLRWELVRLASGCGLWGRV